MMLAASIFGGKSNFIKRCQGKISKEEFRAKRIEPLWICGEATHYHGNRKFRIQDDLKSILFKPNKKTKIYLTLPRMKKNYEKILKKLCKHAEIDDMPITFSIDQEHVRISNALSILGSRGSEACGDYCHYPAEAGQASSMKQECLAVKPRRMAVIFSDCQF